MRKKIVAGNWKMNTDLESAKKLATEIIEKSKKTSANLIISPPFSFLLPVQQITENSVVSVASQNCSKYEKGAYTGDVSSKMIASIGVESTILGHSERREYFQETNEILSEKLKRALEDSLNVIFCVGETLEEREKNVQESVIASQLEVIFSNEKTTAKNTIIAYEPVWAIGTGKTATPEQAESIHHFIRSLSEKKKGKDFSENISLLYGGSCNPKNAKELFSQPNIDGGLVGGASLNSDDFIAIAQSF